ncbi:MAG: RNB domain-containing ribonuclease [Chlorobi bacterium]|nr:RNB domain-containing ribonuclease [Chlorobiota bacterium]
MPPKDKLIDLVSFVKGFGYSLPVDNIKPKDIQRLIDQARERGHEQLITEVTLRSMARAVYSEQNIGHFGLAFPWYTHFTSPIRRYPDLVVHRMLNEYLTGMSGSRVARHAENIGWIADHSSQRERVAVDAERRSIKIAEVEFLAKHVGDLFEATIISPLPFGMFAELKDLGVEGLIPTRTLSDDHYRFDERKKELIGKRKGKRYRIGDNVFVRVEKVDKINQEIDLGLIDMEEYESRVEESGVEGRRVESQSRKLRTES